MARPAATRCPPGHWRHLLASLLLIAGAVHAASTAASDRASVNLSLLEGPGLPNAVQDLYLEVIVNHVPAQRVIHVAMDEAGRLYAWPQNLRDLGLRLDELPANRYVGLDTLPDFEHRYDAQRQQLHLDAAAARLDRRRQRLNTVPEPAWPAQASSGALLNYDVYASHDEYAALAAATALRIFGNRGVFESTGLSRFDESGDNRSYLRLDSTWTLSSQRELWTLSVGDVVSGALPWTRATRLGGLQWRRDFALQPGLITSPIPQFFGEAALPSAIELYVDGVRRYRGEVLPGPFELATPPSVNGAGNAQIVITDVLGRSQIVDFGYYNANRLLRAGLTDYAVEIGGVRRSYGLESFDYRSGVAASGSVRHGLADWLTLEAHGEGEDGLLTGGIGAALGAAGGGTLHGAYARSGGDGNGGQVSLGYNWTAYGYTADYSLQRTHGDYRDLASAEGRAPPLRAERALLGASLGDAGSLSLNYTRLDTREDGRLRSIGASYNVALLRRLSLFAGASRELGGEHGTSVFAGLSLSLGDAMSAGISSNRTDGRARYGASVSQPIPADGGGGWALRAEHGDDSRIYQAEAGLRGDRAQFRAGAQSINEREGVYAGIVGALVFMERKLFAARQVDQGFALVSTNGMAGVPVLLENRPIGHTDANGHYLLTGLNAWQPNQVSIDPLVLPPQVQFDRSRVQAVPVDRAGTVAEFGLRVVRAALLILHDERGQPIALGSRVLYDNAGAAVVGYDGQTYLEDLKPMNRIDVLRADAPGCTVRFAWPAKADDIPVIGPLVCAE